MKKNLKKHKEEKKTKDNRGKKKKKLSVLRRDWIAVCSVSFLFSRAYKSRLVFFFIFCYHYNN